MAIDRFSAHAPADLSVEKFNSPLDYITIDIITCLI